MLTCASHNGGVSLYRVTKETENYQERLWLLEIANVYDSSERKMDHSRQKEIEALEQKKYYSLKTLTDYLIGKITNTHNAGQGKKVRSVEELRNGGRPTTLTINQPERNIIGINIKINESIVDTLSENFRGTMPFMHSYSSFGHDAYENLSRKFFFLLCSQ